MIASTTAWVNSYAVCCIPTKVPLNWLQGHQLKGRFWWFIGVYLQSTAFVKNIDPIAGCKHIGLGS